MVNVMCIEVWNIYYFTQNVSRDLLKHCSEKPHVVYIVINKINCTRKRCVSSRADKEAVSCSSVYLHTDHYNFHNYASLRDSIEANRIIRTGPESARFNHTEDDRGVTGSSAWYDYINGNVKNFRTFQSRWFFPVREMLNVHTNNRRGFSHRYTIVLKSL